MSVRVGGIAGHLPATVHAAKAPLAARQAAWIARLEPWRGLGYRPETLRKFLRRAASAGQAFVASWPLSSKVEPEVEPMGVLVLQPGVLLGGFVALLAVRPEAAGRGIGRALMAHAEARTFVERRWLFVSADAENRDALRFYRQLGFTRVGRLPDLVRQGRVEILLRKGQ